ncbi:hypothetical protein H8E07_19145 [bacterium]|nr:hypothetical protein [bacterium]
MRIVKAQLALSILAVLALTLGGADGARADNLLVNSDFESGDLTGWVVAGQSASSNVTVLPGDNGPACPGSNRAFMDSQAEAMGLTLKQTTENGTAIGGATLYSFDLKLDQADNGGVLFVEIFAEQEGVGIIGGTGLMGPFWPWGQWTTYNGSFEAPANTNFFTIQIMANTGANIGSNCLAHVDNVVLDQGTVANESLTWSGVKTLYR